MFRKLTRRPKVPDSLLDEAEGLTEVNRHDLKSILRQFLQNNPGFHDIYRVFLETKKKRLYPRGNTQDESIAHLRCLTDVDKDIATSVLHTTEPPGNVLHAIERLVQSSRISATDGRCAIFQYVLGCSRDLAHQYSHETSILEMITAAEREQRVTRKEAMIARYAFYLLLDPEEVGLICSSEGIDENQEAGLDQIAQIAQTSRVHYWCNDWLGIRVARTRQWKPIPRDEIQDIMDKGFGNTDEEVRAEYLARKIMQQHQVSDGAPKIQQQRGES